MAKPTFARRSSLKSLSLSGKKQTKLAARNLKKFSQKVQRRWVFLKNRAYMAEDAHTRKHFEGIPERLEFQMVRDPQVGYKLFDTRERNGLSFVSFRIDDLPWNFDEPERNIDLVKTLIPAESPLKVLDIYYKAVEEEKTPVSLYVEEAVAEAIKEGLHSKLWEEDLEGVASHINTNRIAHQRIGIISPEQLSPNGTIKEIVRSSLSRPELVATIFSLLNGFWNKSFWNQLKESLEERRSIEQAIIPYSLRRTNEAVKVHGLAGDLFLSAIHIYGLGVGLRNPSDPQSLVLNTDTWLKAFLPYEVREPGDTIILVSTFFSPTVPKVGGKRFLLNNEEMRIGHLVAKETKEMEVAKKAEDERRENHFRLLTDDQRNYLKGFNFGLKFIDEAPDTLVNTSYLLLVQSPSKERTIALSEALINRLKDPKRDRNVYLEKATSRARQLSAIRSAFPIITKEDVTTFTVPLPLMLIDDSLVPEVTETIPDKQLKVLVGKVLPLGEAYYWKFAKSFCLLAGQQSGKTTLLEALVIRLDGMLPKKSVFWIYDGTDALEEDADRIRAYGWSAIARHLNRQMEKTGLPPAISDGVVYASGYEDPNDLQRDVTLLRDAGARLIVFSALEAQHRRHEIEYGFFEAFKEHMRLGIPGVFFVDEIAHLAYDRRAEVLFQELAPGMTKRNQWFGWTGQTSTYLPEKPKSIRRAALGNTKTVCIGSTPLIADIADDTNINIALFEEKARALSETIAEFTVRDVPGVFAAVEAGGKIITPFQVIIEAESSVSLVRRKTEEDIVRYGR